MERGNDDLELREIMKILKTLLFATLGCALLLAQSAGVTEVTVTYSATPTFTVNSGVTNFTITLTGNVTSSTFSSAAVGFGSFSVCQDVSGSHTFAYPANFVGFPVVTSTGSGCTRTAWHYDGTSVYAMAGVTGPQGPAGSTGPSGSNGTNGTGYLATSTTSLATAGSGSKSFTTQANLAYTAGARIRATSAGTAEYMEGLVTSYSSTTLVATMDRNSGTGTHADWNINLVGDVGASGSGTGTINAGANSAQLAQYTGSGIVVGPATVSGDATMAAGGALTIAANAVTSAKMAVVNTRRTVCLTAGAKNASAALADTDLADSDVYFIPAAGTLVEITVHADAGTPNIILGRDRAGSTVALTSAALATAASGAIACSKATAVTGLDGTTTCSATLQNTSLNAGDWLYMSSGTAGGTAKQMTACATFTVN